MPIIRIAVAGVALLAATASAVAQNWPTRPMTMVVPFAAGGSSDVIARIVADGLGAELGQPVVVENVGGAGGMIGANRVAKASPDGYQFVLGNLGTHAENQSLYKRPLYNAATDFAPVGLVTYQSLVLITRNDFPADNLQMFITYAKANQAKMQFGSSGAGGTNHLACVLLNAAIGINVTHVPYRGAAQVMQDLLGGRVDYQCPSAPAALPQIEAKAVKALAILRKDRSPSMPDLPSAAEQGLAGLDIPSWYALFLPKATPALIVQKLNHAMVAALQTPLAQRRLKEIGSDLVPPDRMSPDYLGRFVAAEIEKWREVIKASRIQLN